MMERIRGVWEWLLAGLLIIIGALAYLTIRTAPRKRAEPPRVDTARADEVAEALIDARYRMDVERTQQDLQRKDAHQRTADRW